ncbi:tRNA uridine-5-carboxymethylaminomethyl(34) synthesis GTPase MnmE [Anoxybacterium hadale]|uniref:tRNA uridine-5-carboxymethylaminomethyl(34) synthesis GTPase MnmE n=1 Tax=Anoxybacterium hadale TaxID=3408580 RepID=A0ACD1AE31_9FIRM|nr:tRNA uridine-5-carboxymethylaminomethyl(34) synthesis GTPase MnmE [Clostridiales bacterium]
MLMDDTIAAIATAYGEGGIGIIRLSGEKSKEILDTVFVPKQNEYRESIVNRRLYYGHIVDPATKQVVDEVLAVYMKGPHTYTAEDIVEVNCHGSIVALRKTLALILKSGARLAEKGEFTKRAFLNGRLDLSQAEAVIDIVRAKTDKTFDVALLQMEGALSQRVGQIRQALMDLLVDITVNLDYPDEDIEILTYQKLSESILLISNMIDALQATSGAGRILREGLNVAIIGKPNVGKSSLMNALLRESRAIVTEIPGTTRDTIEEVISIKDIPVKLTDTAGIRETEDKIEKIGIEKSKESFNRADLVIFILDGSKPMESEDLSIIEKLEGRNVIVLLNKEDLGIEVSQEKINQMLPGATVIRSAVKNGHGINALEDAIERLVFGGKVKQEDSLLVTNVRHMELLEQAAAAIKDAGTMAKNAEALDFIEVDVRRSWELLGEIIGESVTEDIIDQVFARFCLGK